LAIQFMHEAGISSDRHGADYGGCSILPVGMRRKFNLFVILSSSACKRDRNAQFRHGLKGYDTNLYGQGHRNE
jgi:hypothetical protein